MKVLIPPPELGEYTTICAGCTSTLLVTDKDVINIRYDPRAKIRYAEKNHRGIFKKFYDIDRVITSGYYYRIICPICGHRMEILFNTSEHYDEVKNIKRENKSRIL